MKRKSVIIVFAALVAVVVGYACWTILEEPVPLRMDEWRLPGSDVQESGALGDVEFERLRITSPFDDVVKAYATKGKAAEDEFNSRVSGNPFTGWVRSVVLPVGEPEAMRSAMTINVGDRFYVIFIEAIDEAETRVDLLGTIHPKDEPVERSWRFFGENVRIKSAAIAQGRINGAEMIVVSEGGGSFIKELTGRGFRPLGQGAGFPVTLVQEGSDGMSVVRVWNEATTEPGQVSVFRLR